MTLLYIEIKNKWQVQVVEVDKLKSKTMKAVNNNRYPAHRNKKTLFRNEPAIERNEYAADRTLGVTWRNQ